MLQQTFVLSDIFRVSVLAFLEILLSADNAIVLGLISSALPAPLRKRALYIGFLSAIIFRAFGILSISIFLKFLWIQLIAAFYLVYLSLRHFIKDKKKHESLMPHPVRSFWKTVCLIELFDLAFAMDSITAGIAFIQPFDTLGINPKLWIVYIGGLVGIVFIRYAANLFSNLVHRFSRLESSAYLLIGWIGLKLGCAAWMKSFFYFDLVFWTGIVILFLIGFIPSSRKD